MDDVAPVSYTHLDVYKRQSMQSTQVMRLNPAELNAIRLNLRSIDPEEYCHSRMRGNDDPVSFTLFHPLG